jgi:hypothetical protein
MSGIEVPFMRGIDIDDRAARCRRKLAPGTAVDASVDMQQVLENLDGTEVRLPDATSAQVAFGVVKLPSNILGVTTFKKAGPTIHVDVSEETYRDMDHDGRARFTAPHEVGHVVLHLDQLVQMTQLPHAELALARNSNVHPQWCDSEIQANRFAAAFMAPDAGLEQLRRRGELDADHVMTTFGMSRSAAEARINNFKKAAAFRERDARRPRWAGGR